MKNFILLIFFFLSVSVIGQNIEVKNGSFEKWKNENDLPASWIRLFKGEGVISKWTDAQSGENSMRIIFTPENDGQNKKFSSSDISLKKGNYTVTCFFKGEGEVRFISLTQKGETAARRSSAKNAVGTPQIGKIKVDKWTQYDLAFVVEEDENYRLTFAINSGSEKVPFLLDNITIKKD